jgi:acetamidase/formamidase
VGPDLMEATRDAVRATITYLGERYGLDREEAYALTSVATDLRIHEIVDAPNWVVGAFVPESIFVEGGRG